MADNPTLGQKAAAIANGLRNEFDRVAAAAIGHREFLDLPLAHIDLAHGAG